MAKENIFFGASAARFVVICQLLVDHNVDGSALSLGATFEAIVGAASLPAAVAGDVGGGVLVGGTAVGQGQGPTGDGGVVQGEGLVVVVCLALP
jgi:hypothetical protein